MIIAVRDCHKFTLDVSILYRFNEILEDAKAYAETMVTGDKTKLNNFASNIGYLAEELSKIHLEGTS